MPGASDSTARRTVTLSATASARAERPHAAAADLALYRFRPLERSSASHVSPLFAPFERRVEAKHLNTTCHGVVQDRTNGLPVCIVKRIAKPTKVTLILPILYR